MFARNEKESMSLPQLKKFNEMFHVTLLFMFENKETVKKAILPYTRTMNKLSSVTSFVYNCLILLLFCFNVYLYGHSTKKTFMQINDLMTSIWLIKGRYFATKINRLWSENPHFPRCVMCALHNEILYF